MRAAVTLLALALIFQATAPTDASAQQRCDQVRRSDFRRIVTEHGHEIMYYRQPVRMICTGDIEIEADSAIMNSTTSSVELVGTVLYRDNERKLTADWAHYLAQGDELFARGNVVLTDMADGSTIHGDDFQYRRESETRLESHMIMRGHRPHAQLRRASPTSSEPAAPILVWARRLELLGETLFLAQNDVEIEREDLRGSGDSARFDQVADRMTLTGNARVETVDYQLEGHRIDAHLDGDDVREVFSEGSASLLAEDLTIEGDNIRIGFHGGQPERVEAWNQRKRAPTPEADDRQPPDALAQAAQELEPAPAEGQVPAVEETDEDRETEIERVLAVSRDFRLLADSIDARSAQGRIQEVRAVGRAYGEGAGNASFAELPDDISRDWTQGDTINTYFTQPGAVGADPEDSERADEVVIERIEVIGGSADALSFYRTEPAEGGDRPDLNFTRAKRITLFMKDGEVDRVEVEGPLEGLYLSPQRAEGDGEPRTEGPDRRTAAGRPR